jgi:formate-nitrite transporter family protein
MSAPPTLRMPVTDRDHADGPADAPVTLVEYGDYECPHCGRAYPLIKRLQKELKPHLRFVFRHFPLAEIHPHAVHAAAAAEGAAHQGKFWAMHDAIFEHQNRLDDRSLVLYAAQIGLDAQKFLESMGSPEVEARIAADLLAGARSGVNGTPTLFINGVRYDGEHSYAALLRALTP